MTFTNDIEAVCEAIRTNSVLMSDYHKKRYEYLRSYLKWFKIPLILLNGCNVFFSVGLEPYLASGYISLLTMGVSMVCSILNSVELYLGVEASMSKELVASKEYYILATDLFKILALDRENRNINGKEFMEEHYNRYIKLYEQSNLLNKKIKDSLRPLLQDTNSDKSSDTSLENKI
jgi:hypothetical protein